MGFLSAFCSFVADGVSAAVNWVSDRVDDIKDFFGLGDRGSYTGSVKEAVDVAKVLNDLKEKLSVEAANAEKESIATVIQEFDQFTVEAKKKTEFKKLAEEIEQRKSKVQLNLAGTMMNHINKRLTANDPEFRKVLEMQPGDKKKESLARYADKFNQEAEQEFRDKLKKEMDVLRLEIGKIFEAELSKQQRKLSEVEVAYQKLQYDAKNGQLNLKELEDACIPAVDAERCMKEIFQTGAMV